jgi:hypothetical protein
VRIARVVASMIVATSIPLSAMMQGQRPDPPQVSDTADVQLEGEVEVDVEDGFNGSRIHYRLLTNGRRLVLRFEGAPPHLKTGDRIRARGRLQDDTLTLSASSSSVESLVSVAPNTFGEQPTIVILVNFRNNTSQPYSWSTAQQVTFGAVSAFFQENSYGQTWLTGDVFGWFTLDMDAPASSCDYSKIATLAETAASAAGAPLSQYRRRVIAFPSASGCGWWGLGNVGGSTTRAWVNGSYALKVVAHELGHNFGDYHSNSMPCDAGGCGPVEYGDTHDVMGNPSSGHLNAFQKERLGWLDYGNSPAIESVTSGGAYWIEAMSGAGSGAKALRILKSVDGSGKRTWYYVEARAQVGFDEAIAPGVLVHTGSEATGNSSYQVDLTPTTTSFDRVLDVGQTFTDDTAGLSISTTSAGQSGAWVQVTYGGAPCVTASPSLSLLPGSNLSVGIGQAANYTLRVKNNDGTGCPAASLALSAAVPTGWSSVVGVPVVQLNAGETTDVALTVVPAATSGTHGFTASAARQGTSGPGASVAGAVTVIGSIDVSLHITRTGQNYQLSATVSSGSAAVSGATVSFRIANADGAVTTMSATTTSSGVATVAFKPGKKDPRGSYTVTATATSGSMTASTTGTFSR